MAEWGIAMRIYLLRHGIAEEGAGMRDSARALTSEGTQKVSQLMKVARRAGVAPTLVISSPYRRALETARIAIDELDYKGPLVESTSLTPDSSTQSAWNDVRVHAGEESILLVGHEPLFSGLSAYLLGWPEVSIDFKKGALLCIDVYTVRAQPAGVLQWYLTSKLAAAI
jgi:phosphohistidine phosphatase